MRIVYHFKPNTMCDFCEKKEVDMGFIKKKEHKNDSLFGSVSVVIKKDQLVIDYNAYSCDSDLYEEVKINFCPMCGRDLRE